MRLLYVPLLSGALVPWVGRWLAVRGRPRAGAWILAGLTAVVALASMWAFALLAGTLLEDLAPVEDPADLEPISDPEAVVGVLLLMAAAVQLLRSERTHRRLHKDLQQACELSSGGRLVVLADQDPYAFVVPGRHERIVVTDGMLRALTPAQRRVLFAHEEAHLTHAHHRFRAVARLTSAVNPLLLPARATMAFLCERWADEHAATSVGDRLLAARSLTAAAMVTVNVNRAAQAFQDLHVTRRIAALRRPEPRPVLLAILAAAALAVITLAGDLDATWAFEQFIAPYLR